jgi:hypothetical protein
MPTQSGGSSCSFHVISDGMPDNMTELYQRSFDNHTLGYYYVSHSTTPKQPYGAMPSDLQKHVLKIINFSQAEYM